MDRSEEQSHRAPKASRDARHRRQSKVKTDLRDLFKILPILSYLEYMGPLRHSAVSRFRELTQSVPEKWLPRQ